MTDNNQTGKKGGALWLILVAVMVVVLLIIGGIAIYKNLPGNQPDTEDSQVGTTQDSENQTETGGTTEMESESETQIEEPNPSDGSETFVMFGVDVTGSYMGKGTRSDSLMLINVNHDKGQVKVISIYRDCMVDQKEYGYKKISNAHSYGGQEFALSVINENFDLNLEKYVTVNFTTLTNLVNKIGGVEIELTDAEIAEINKSCSPKLEGAGKHVLNGAQALAFSRIRRIDNDYNRTERQREVLFEIFETAKGMSTLDRIDLADSMMNQMVTNYSTDEITSLLYYVSKYEIITMTAYPQVFYGGIVEGSWVEVPVTLVDMNAALHKELYGTESYTPSSRVEEISATLRGKVSGANHDQRKQED